MFKRVFQNRACGLMHDRYIKFLLVLEQGQVYEPSAATPEKKDRLKYWSKATDKQAIS